MGMTFFMLQDVSPIEHDCTYLNDLVNICIQYYGNNVIWSFCNQYFPHVSKFIILLFENDNMLCVSMFTSYI